MSEAEETMHRRSMMTIPTYPLTYDTNRFKSVRGMYSHETEENTMLETASLAGEWRVRQIVDLTQVFFEVDHTPHWEDIESLPLY
jgi:hypothetical protein